MNMAAGAFESVEGKVAIVTGGASGIGKATCRLLAVHGATIVVVDRPGPALDAVGAELQALQPGVRQLALGLDVTREADTEHFAVTTLERFGRIDVLICSAGILRAPGTLPKPMASLSLEEWRSVIDVNLTGVFLSNRAVLPSMMRQRSGNIINISSTSGRHGRAHDSAYSASKFGVVGLSESLADEVRSRNIKVQAIFPDAVDTPIWDQNGPIKPEQALPPERVAQLIAFMIALPDDTLLVAPGIAPFKPRRRPADRASGTPADAEHERSAAAEPNP